MSGHPHQVAVHIYISWNNHAIPYNLFVLVSAGMLPGGVCTADGAGAMKSMFAMCRRCPLAGAAAACRRGIHKTISCRAFRRENAPASH